MEMLRKNIKFIFAALGILVLAVLMMDLNSRLSDLFRLSSQRDQMLTQVGDLKATQAMYEEQITYATSQAAVEQWARSEGHLARPGDQVIVPIAPANVTPTPVVIPTPTTSAFSNIEIWRVLFLGK